MPRRYAAGTEVTAAKSRDEIERTLIRFGADQFAYGWADNDAQRLAVVQFRAGGRLIRLTLPLPSSDERRFTHTPTGQKRAAQTAGTEWEKACREQWRALALLVKAKLAAVDAGISTLELEFLAHVVLPDGTTVGGFMAPQIERAYELGRMPSALPALEAGGE